MFEGVVEIKNVVRIPGYKSKVVVASNSKEIDPVGTCVGVGGVRIRPILKELGQEKVDLIEHDEDLETLVASALKPAEIDKVVVTKEGTSATVWLAQDQRSFAIGKQGQNIALVSRLTGLHVQLQAEDAAEKNEMPSIQEIAEELNASQAEAPAGVTVGMGTGSKGAVPEDSSDVEEVASSDEQTATDEDSKE